MAYTQAAGTEPRVDGNTVRFAPLPALEPGQRADWRVMAECRGEGDLRIAVSVETDEHKVPVRETEATRIYNQV